MRIRSRLSKIQSPITSKCEKERNFKKNVDTKAEELKLSYYEYKYDEFFDEILLTENTIINIKEYKLLFDQIKNKTEENGNLTEKNNQFVSKLDRWDRKISYNI